MVHRHSSCIFFWHGNIAADMTTHWPLRSCIKQSQMFLTKDVWTITHLEPIVFEPRIQPSWTVSCERPRMSTKRGAWLFPLSNITSCNISVAFARLGQNHLISVCNLSFRLVNESLPIHPIYTPDPLSGEWQKLWKIYYDWVHVAKTSKQWTSLLLICCQVIMVQSHHPQNFVGAELECRLTKTRNFAPPQKQTGSAHPKLTLSQGKEETTILPWCNDTEQSELKKTSSAFRRRDSILPDSSRHSDRSAYFCMLSSSGEPSSFCDLACSRLICTLQHTDAKLLVNLVNARETLLGVMPEP